MAEKAKDTAEAKGQAPADGAGAPAGDGPDDTKGTAALTDAERAELEELRAKRTEYDEGIEAMRQVRARTAGLGTAVDVGAAMAGGLVPRLDEAPAGGRYRIGDRLVDANGAEVKG